MVRIILISISVVTSCWLRSQSLDTDSLPNSFTYMSEDSSLYSFRFKKGKLSEIIVGNSLLYDSLVFFNKNESYIKFNYSVNEVNSLISQNAENNQDSKISIHELSFKSVNNLAVRVMYDEKKRKLISIKEKKGNLFLGAEKNNGICLLFYKSGRLKSVTHYVDGVQEGYFLVLKRNRKIKKLYVVTRKKVS